MTRGEFKQWVRWRYGPPADAPVGVRLELHKEAAGKLFGLLDLLGKFTVAELTVDVLNALIMAAPYLRYNKARAATYCNAAGTLWGMFELLDGVDSVVALRENL